MSIISKNKQEQKPLQRRKVLSEEEYQSTLSSIVQRDYFPDLPELEKQVRIQQCREQGDFKGAVAIRRAVRRVQEHEAALARQEVEDEQEEDASGMLRATARPLHRETITGFHARVTSQDNQEFEETRKTESEMRQRHIQKVYRGINNTNSRNNNNTECLQNGTTETQRFLGSETPLLASDLFDPPSFSVTTSRNPNMDNGFFFAPQLLPGSFTHGDLEDMEAPTKLLTAAAGNDSMLMPPPAFVKKKDTTAMTLATKKQNLVEYIPKHKLECRIEPSQTRFPTGNAMVRRPAIVHDDSTTDYSTEASTDLDEPANFTLHLERIQGRKRQKRELETLVAMTPLIAPQASPITTWGTVSSTPMVLGKDAETQAFALPKESERDQAARAAQDLMDQRHRSTMLQRQHASMTTRKKKNGSASSVDRMSNLTPAARSLLQKSSMLSSSSSVRSSSAFSSALRKSYTPKRQQSNIYTNRRHASTPQASRNTIAGTKKTSTILTTDKLTEGLLNL